MGAVVQGDRLIIIEVARPLTCLIVGPGHPGNSECMQVGQAVPTRCRSLVVTALNMTSDPLELDMLANIATPFPGTWKAMRPKPPRASLQIRTLATNPYSPLLALPRYVIVVEL